MPIIAIDILTKFVADIFLANGVPSDAAQSRRSASRRRRRLRRLVAWHHSRAAIRAGIGTESASSPMQTDRHPRRPGHRRSRRRPRFRTGDDSRGDGRRRQTGRNCRRRGGDAGQLRTYGKTRQLHRTGSQIRHGRADDVKYRRTRPMGGAVWRSGGAPGDEPLQHRRPDGNKRTSDVRFRDEHRAGRAGPFSADGGREAACRLDHRSPGASLDGTRPICTGPPRGALLPFGGHKGFGLSMLIDALRRRSVGRPAVARRPIGRWTAKRTEFFWLPSTWPRFVRWQNSSRWSRD